MYPDSVNKKGICTCICHCSFHTDLTVFYMLPLSVPCFFGYLVRVSNSHFMFCLVQFRNNGWFMWWILTVYCAMLCLFLSLTWFFIEKIQSFLFFIFTFIFILFYFFCNKSKFPNVCFSVENTYTFFFSWQCCFSFLFIWNPCQTVCWLSVKWSVRF